MRITFSLLFIAFAILCCAQKSESPKARSGNYEITLRLPPDGLYAGEESEIEVHIADMTAVDPVLGPTPLIRSEVQATISMPSMPGMPNFREKAHVEGVPGDYGIHPTFAHGGDFHLALNIKPLIGTSFLAEFPLSVGDAHAGKTHKKLAPAFRMDRVVMPKSPKAGEPAILTLTFHSRDSAKEALSEFDLVHERPVHLIIVRDDLGTFAHVHPEMSSAGLFRVSYKFPTSGEFHLFADVAPKGSGSQILSSKIKVSGAPGEHYTLPQPSVSAAPVTDGDLTITLKSASTLPVAKSVPITFELKDIATQAVPTGMEPYLAAKGHLLMVSQDGGTFVHAHPDENDTPGRVTFVARLPKPGLYRAWAQFQRNGVIRTASVTIKGE